MLDLRGRLGAWGAASTFSFSSTPHKGNDFLSGEAGVESGNTKRDSSLSAWRSASHWSMGSSESSQFPLRAGVARQGTLLSSAMAYIPTRVRSQL